MAECVKTVLPCCGALGERLLVRFPHGFSLEDILSSPDLAFEDREEFRWNHYNGAQEYVLGDIACVRDGDRWRVEDRRGEALRWLQDVLGFAGIQTGRPVDLADPRVVLDLIQAEAKVANPLKPEHRKEYDLADVQQACEAVAKSQAEKSQQPVIPGLGIVRSIVQKVECFLLNLEEQRDLENDPISELPLLCAAFDGDLEEVRRLLAAGVPVDEVDSNGDRAVSWAAVRGNLEMVKLLRAAGADLKLRGENGWSLLHSAMECPELGLVKYLLDEGVPADATAEDGTTVLHMAAYGGGEEVIDLLVAHGAQVNAVCNRETPLDNAMAFSLHETALALRKHGGKFSIDL